MSVHKPLEGIKVVELAVLWLRLQQGECWQKWERM